MASLLSTGKSFERLNSFPLDASSIQLTLADAIDYATNNPTAYTGQLIYISDTRTQDKIDSSLDIYGKLMYIDNNNTLQEIGTETGESDIIISRGGLSRSITILPDDGTVNVNFDSTTGDIIVTGATMNFNDTIGNLEITGATLSYNDITRDFNYKLINNYKRKEMI